MTLNELNAAIIKWADDREITKHSTPFAQAYNAIKDRKGKLLPNGIFVKEE